jgi:hypothetical protein
MKQDRAETLALQALAWMAADDDMAARFAGATGASLPEARNRLEDPVFLASVLEFLLMEDRWVMAFCDTHGLPYEAPMQALVALPGGRRDEWP